MEPIAPLQLPKELLPNTAGGAPVVAPPGQLGTPAAPSHSTASQKLPELPPAPSHRPADLRPFPVAPLRPNRPLAPTPPPPPVPIPPMSRHQTVARRPTPTGPPSGVVPTLPVRPLLAPPRPMQIYLPHPRQEAPPRPAAASLPSLASRDVAGRPSLRPLSPLATPPVVDRLKTPAPPMPPAVKDSHAPLENVAVAEGDASIPLLHKIVAGIAALVSRPREAERETTTGRSQVQISSLYPPYRLQR